ncbi:urease accessory protein UreG [Campylobacter pinnipediorum]|uniref:Urease accessory protein UreG n=1 Tax=Campylobacter pinnipediorum subsp. pinnipediorum TaxID=1660067 RepID=A0AAX0L7Y7_9BACT|nr:urease accessory protein UreG [Campylobacter pinnipediorum]AQW80820.1 urease accessory protein UreG [Campylobacter pinnipediorum subsp. pinnipediorum]AQW82440.1 urease accessory protein UreG [Campylobacter pinnipediorum subsp. pinnipediorum]AQW84110.1 urease accessory protein UreG [Campylobacter pinnipediorum subsp. pinnipediorum]OPA74822.1 urease accessory protein UreG [Campylobacter pinnipediorum subsp. pinnipediorum]
MKYIKIGVAGPVGCGKTHLIEQLVGEFSKDYSVGVVTNDIYTKEDANFLKNSGVIDGKRIRGVETGGCPHTAIRDDVSMNLEAVEELANAYPDLQIVFIESGGDNLSATFSPDLADATIFVIDVAEGGDIPRKGGPGITRSDMLVINKIDLAPYVEVDLQKMRTDTIAQRKNLPFAMTNLKSKQGLNELFAWIRKDVLFEDDK